MTRKSGIPGTRKVRSYRSQRRSSNSPSKSRQQKVPRIEEIASALVGEESAAAALPASSCNLPSAYAEFVLRGQLTNVRTAHLSQKRRLERTFDHLDRSVVAYKVIRRQLSILAEHEFSSVPAFLNEKDFILDNAVDDAFSRRDLYLLYGFQELSLVRDVLWPEVKRIIAAQLSVDVEVDDTAYECWLEQLSITMRD